MCTVLLPPGGNPSAVNKYIIYHTFVVYGRAICDSDGRAICDSDGPAICDSDGRTICDSDGRAICDSDGRTICDSDGRRFLTASAPSSVQG
jgi:hypothetical protein